MIRFQQKHPGTRHDSIDHLDLFLLVVFNYVQFEISNKDQPETNQIDLKRRSLTLYMQKKKLLIF